MAQGSGPLSRWVTLLGRYDASPAVVCKDVDVSLNGRIASHSELADVVRVLGVQVTGPGPWRYNCDGSASISPPMASSSSVNVPPLISVSSAMSDLPDGATAAGLSALQQLFEGGESKVDRLIAVGFVPEGCVGGASGALRLRLQFRGRTVYANQSDVARSKAPYAIECSASGRQPMIQVSAADAMPEDMPTHWNSYCRYDLACYTDSEMKDQWQAMIDGWRREKGLIE